MAINFTRETSLKNTPLKFWTIWSLNRASMYTLGDLVNNKDIDFISQYNIAKRESSIIRLLINNVFYSEITTITSEVPSPEDVQKHIAIKEILKATTHDGIARASHMPVKTMIDLQNPIYNSTGESIETIANEAGLGWKNSYKDNKPAYLKVFEKYADPKDNNIYVEIVPIRKRDSVGQAALRFQTSKKELAESEGYHWIDDSLLYPTPDYMINKFKDDPDKLPTKPTTIKKDINNILRDNCVFKNLVYLKSHTKEYVKIRKAANYRNMTLKEYIISLDYDWNPSLAKVIIEMQNKASDKQLKIKKTDIEYQHITAEAVKDNLSITDFGKKYGFDIKLTN